MGKRKKSQPVKNAAINVEAIDFRSFSCADSSEKSLQSEIIDHDDQNKENSLEAILQSCSFYVQLHKTNVLKHHKCVALLGDIHLNLLGDNQIIDDGNFYLYVHEIANLSILYCERNDPKKTVSYYPVEYEIPFDAINGLKRNFRNIFHIVYVIDGDKIVLKIYLSKKGLLQLDFPSQIIKTTSDNSVQYLMSILCDIEVSPCTIQETEHVADITEIYELTHSSKKLNAEITSKCTCNFMTESENESTYICLCQNRHPDLIPELRKYQTEAVRWMLHRENDQSERSYENELHPLYKEIFSSEGKLLYYNYVEGFFVENKPLVAEKIVGGILADEMGLGKTIEVMACILSNKRSPKNIQKKLSALDSTIFQRSFDDDSIEDLNESDDDSSFACSCGVHTLASKRKRRKLSKFFKVRCALCRVIQHAECMNFKEPDNSKYLCPHCCVLQMIPSKTTLIISPYTISRQWLEELHRHVKANVIEVFVYTGVHKQGFIQPRDLAKYDIILCTYETLRKELDYASLPHFNSESSRTLRNPKRFMTIPSPLLGIEFWRICLDEAQMIESTLTKTAEMALKLTTINRWCVTGTPIQQSLDDLYGLLLFLGIDPVFVRSYWLKLIKIPFEKGNHEPLNTLLSRYLWRSTKKEVIDQIKIPEQKVLTHWLSFSPVENHFYEQEHDRCSSFILHKISQYTDLTLTLSSLDKKQVSNLMLTLRTLRQACCHPQIVRGQFIPIQKSIISMEEVLKTLIKKSILAAEEAHRNVIATFNGCAGIYVIKQDYENAVEAYREALNSIEEHKDSLKTDKLQKLHTLHNLAELLDIVSTSNEKIGRTVRDDYLKQESNELRQAYLDKSINLVIQSQSSLLKAKLGVDELKKEMSSENNWWMNVLDSLNVDVAFNFIKKLKTDLSHLKICNKFNNSSGLVYMLTCNLDDLHSAHDELTNTVITLPKNPDRDTINAAIDCHLRPVKKSKAPKCLYCKTQAYFINYENKLFSFDEKFNLDEPSTSEDALLQNQRRGTWADSETEVILKFILTFAKQQKSALNWIENGNFHIKLFDAWKKEFKGLRSVWMQKTDYVSAIDELEMAVTRMRLKYPDEPEGDPPLKHVLDPAEVDQQLVSLKSDRAHYTCSLKQKLGQVFYLKNLEKAQCENSNPEPCPICQKQLGEQWSILQCGHCFCTECIRIMTTEYSLGGRQNHLKCAVCRNRTNHSDISYVVSKPENFVEESEIGVKGSHSTKIEAVIRCILRIQLEDPSAKIIAFSTWQDLLNVLSEGLKQNDLSHEMLQSGPKYEKALNSFKTNPSINILLLLIRSGSKGLNLINATHVILMEPLLNLGNENQAIGRVHRIGQTKPTFVHKFLLKKTIEEKIYNMQRFSTNKNLESKNEAEDNITLNDLKNLFNLDN